jgi:uncharacterized protein (DUF924 family)
MGMNDTNVPGGALDARAVELLSEWFDDAVRNEGGAAAWWFAVDAARDARLRSRFGSLLRDAADARLGAWSATPRGRLALILLLDQLPRNCYRGTAAAFATDAQALAETQRGLVRADDRALDPWERTFFYMPLQHAEDAAVQRQSVDCYARLAAEVPAAARATFEGTLEYARLHCEIVLRFGRFPHRNAVLGRSSTPVEQAWLAAGAPDFGQGTAG